MSIVANGTVPLSDAWSGYLANAQAQLVATNTRAILLLLVNIPILAVVVNVMRQLVGLCIMLNLFLLLSTFSAQVLPRKSSDPPVVFHWLPIIGSAIGYGTDPLGFFFKCREKVSLAFWFLFPTTC